MPKGKGYGMKKKGGSKPGNKPMGRGKMKRTAKKNRLSGTAGGNT